MSTENISTGRDLASKAGAIRIGLFCLGEHKLTQHEYVRETRSNKVVYDEYRCTDCGQMRVIRAPNDRQPRLVREAQA